MTEGHSRQSSTPLKKLRFSVLRNSIQKTTGMEEEERLRKDEEERLQKEEEDRLRKEEERLWKPLVRIKMITTPVSEHSVL